MESATVATLKCEQGNGEQCRGNERVNDERLQVVPPRTDENIAQKKNMRRRHIAEEILETERNYVDQLGAVVQLFKRPLENLHTSHVPRIGAKECELLFSSVEEIFRVNLSLLSKLNVKFKAWSPTQTIGDVFCSWGPEIQPYTEYINNYGTSIRTLNGLCKRREEFATFIHNRTYTRLTLKDLMIVPVQRIPRYTLLLQELLKHTDEKHPDYNTLIEAHEMTKALASKCNEAKRNMDAITRMDDLADRLIGYTRLVQDGRRYVAESKVLQLCEGIGIRKYKKRDLFVFNDILMCVAVDSDEPDCALEFKWLLPLHDSIVSLLSEHADMHDVDGNAIASDGENQPFKSNADTDIPSINHRETATSDGTPRSSIGSENTTTPTEAFSALGLKPVSSGTENEGESSPSLLRKRCSLPFPRLPALPSRPTMSSLRLSSDKASELRSMRRKSSIRSQFVVGLEHVTHSDSEEHSRTTMTPRRSTDSNVSRGSSRLEAKSPSLQSRGSVQSRTSQGHTVFTSRDDEEWCGVRLHHEVHGTHDVYFEDSAEKERVICLVVEAIAACTARRDNVAAQAAQDIKRRMTDKYCGTDVSSARDILNQRNRNRQELRKQELQSYTESTRVKADELKNSFSVMYDLENFVTKAAEQKSEVNSPGVPSPLPERRDRFTNYGGLSAAQNFRLQAAQRQESKGEVKSGSKGGPLLTKVKQLAGLESSGKE